ncbi:MAG: AI-2E family transporter [Flavobacterium sp.]|nr:AI-2E family transporter [Flavobacterium sp.]
MKQQIQFPLYAKIAFTLITLLAIGLLIFIGQNVVIPVLLALLFAILLNPLSEFLKNRVKVPHVFAVLLTVFIFILVLAGIITFLSWQISDLVADWAQIKRNINLHISNLQSAIRENFNLSDTEQKKIIDDATAGESGKSIVSSTLLSVTDTLINLTLLPIYTFLILLYKSHFKKFLCKLYSEEHHAVLEEIMSKIKVSIQGYISGLMLQMVTVSVLTTIGYMMLGIEYAILLGALSGILNLVPYIGILAAGAISIVATLGGSPDVSIIFGVIIVNMVVQFIDNNFLVPVVVSSKVEINALVSIVGIVIGGSLAGIAGMFLAIPMIAILKVIFDRIEPLKPWGYLFGDDLPKTFKWRRIKFPAYNPESATATAPIQPQTQKISFTETTTTTTNSATDDLRDN